MVRRPLPRAGTPNLHPCHPWRWCSIGVSCSVPPLHGWAARPPLLLGCGSTAVAGRAAAGDKCGAVMCERCAACALPQHCQRVRCMMLVCCSSDRLAACTCMDHAACSMIGPPIGASSCLPPLASKAACSAVMHRHTPHTGPRTEQVLQPHHATPQPNPAKATSPPPVQSSSSSRHGSATYLRGGHAARRCQPAWRRCCRGRDRSTAIGQQPLVRAVPTHFS